MSAPAAGLTVVRVQPSRARRWVLELARELVLAQESALSLEQGPVRESEQEWVRPLELLFPPLPLASRWARISRAPRRRTPRAGRWSSR